MMYYSCSVVYTENCQWLSHCKAFCFPFLAMAVFDVSLENGSHHKTVDHLHNVSSVEYHLEERPQKFSAGFNSMNAVQNAKRGFVYSFLFRLLLDYYTIA